MNQTHLKVIAYCRVSTDNQKEEGTINLQTDAITDFAKSKGFELVATFKDEGVSGGLEDRPGLNEMFSYLESEEGKTIDSVLIWKLDRLAQDLYIQEHLIKKFEALKVKLISTKEADLDSGDPMRKAFRQFMGVVSELEKAFITMRLQGGWMQKAKSGGFAGGSTALGYISEDKELKQQATDVETVRTIFKLKKNNHYSINEIARHLNEQGYKTKRGGRWYASTVAYILGNPIYKGKYEYRDIAMPRNDLRVLSV
jgi:site-specific DNA recombinase